jgi:hypothetical protein
VQSSFEPQGAVTVTRVIIADLGGLGASNAHVKNLTVNGSASTSVLQTTTVPTCVELQQLYQGLLSERAHFVKNRGKLDIEIAEVLKKYQKDQIKDLPSLVLIALRSRMIAQAQADTAQIVIMDIEITDVENKLKLNGCATN